MHRHSFTGFNHSPLKILRTIRTRTVCNKSEVLAIALQDFPTSLIGSIKNFKRELYENNLGKTNITKRFVPGYSRNTLITKKRGSENCLDRKCTVIFLDRLPPCLRRRFIEGMVNYCYNVNLKVYLSLSHFFYLATVTDPHM